MCGVAGVFSVERSADVLYDLMASLQYRGEQSSGLLLMNKDGGVCGDRSLGLTCELFRKLNCSNLAQEDFVAGVGHVRYGTAGARDSIINAHPLSASMPWGELHLVHNGDTPSFASQKDELLKKGAVFSTDSDSELLLKYIALSGEDDPVAAVQKGLSRYKGTYSVILLLKCAAGIKLIAARDPSGNRPLVLGSHGQGYVVASENSSFEVVDGKFLREVEPGEMLVISSDGLESRKISEASPRLMRCVFELIYFSFPASKVFGVPVGEFREQLGRVTARKLKNLVEEGDVVTYVPDSGKFFGLGFAKELVRPLEEVLIRRHSTDIVRSFTQSSQDNRYNALRKKLSLRRELVAGKRVWVLDDSVVRGNSSRRLIRALKEHGAVWIGFVSSCPPIIGPCDKGIDFREDLLAAKHTHGTETDVEKVRLELEPNFLDYLHYSSIDDLEEVLGHFKKNTAEYCFGCFQNKEPIWGVW
ncbi:amidophosphoribosyltransferase [Candidatus Giovannonibacteria bacterium]|nr:amidophosphoribosyltransferase [Candidatus Giovannonibacteria bacterium]